MQVHISPAHSTPHTPKLNINARRTDHFFRGGAAGTKCGSTLPDESNARDEGRQNAMMRPAFSPAIAASNGWILHERDVLQMLDVAARFDFPRSVLEGKTDADEAFLPGGGGCHRNQDGLQFHSIGFC
jgi:hypothetical protein